MRVIEQSSNQPKCAVLLVYVKGSGQLVEGKGKTR